MNRKVFEELVEAARQEIAHNGDDLYLGNLSSAMHNAEAELKKQGEILNIGKANCHVVPKGYSVTYIELDCQSAHHITIEKLGDK